RDSRDYGTVAHPQQSVPDAINPVEATTLIMLKENLSLIHNSDVSGHTVAIVGTGPAAQAEALFARLLGASAVGVFARSVRQAERFAALGVDAYVVGDESPQIVRTIMASGGFERVFEAVGSRE